ncbi:UDP-N-acetylmuramoylalanine--D-glutamate ligase [Legionella adelaidensis]|uniref:UDP-N-acetylmuramoylalanine--D-glutamate ligase n=1 Tax=Legionella adelaidensis TaxID=45056 RepID=A0A0W0R5U1_9GAMM|nr:UDP-N-acetylmuramoyl-L-alanine--D-glutamate ligase [Legionella adelaidensis]KTC66432.1 UDP-N-acetylmuramoylalanine--D-glutamate ligase [Legionella adelaidensis]
MKESLYLVVGLGKTGHSIARYLRRRNKPFIVYDTRKNPEGTSEFHAEFPGVDVFLGEFPASLYTNISGVICSPGVPLESSFIQKAQNNGIPVFGDIECLVQEIDAPIVAITGTNGKSTVTTLVGEMAKAAGKRVAVAGNIGLPVLDILDVGVNYDLWVLELSSFQLDLTHSLKPLAATVLNITPDHLDRHHTMEAYVKAKQHIYDQAKIMVYSREDTLTKPKAHNQGEQLVSFGLDFDNGQWGIVNKDNKNYLACGTECLLCVDELRIKGRHNWLNALASCALAHAVGISYSHMVEVLKRFGGLPHRSQWVRNINGVDWINDSKGTNVGATVSSIAGIGGSMQGKIILIAGGQGKGADFSELRTPVGDYVRSVVLIGQDAETIENALANIVPVIHAPSLEMAVQIANKEAKPGDVVLLSPACASFDMFRDFNHRGDDFIAAVNAL